MVTDLELVPRQRGQQRKGEEGGGLFEASRQIRDEDLTLVSELMSRAIAGGDWVQGLVSLWS